MSTSSRGSVRVVPIALSDGSVLSRPRDELSSNSMHKFDHNSANLSNSQGQRTKLTEDRVIPIVMEESGRPLMPLFTHLDHFDSSLRLDDREKRSKETIIPITMTNETVLKEPQPRSPIRIERLTSSPTFPKAHNSFGERPKSTIPTTSYEAPRTTVITPSWSTTPRSASATTRSASATPRATSRSPSLASGLISTTSPIIALATGLNSGSLRRTSLPNPKHNSANNNTAASHHHTLTKDKEFTKEPKDEFRPYSASSTLPRRASSSRASTATCPWATSESCWPSRDERDALKRASPEAFELNLDNRAQNRSATPTSSAINRSLASRRFSENTTTNSVLPEALNKRPPLASASSIRSSATSTSRPSTTTTTSTSRSPPTTRSPTTRSSSTPSARPGSSPSSSSTSGSYATSPISPRLPPTSLLSQLPRKSAIRDSQTSSPPRRRRQHSVRFVDDIDDNKEGRTRRSVSLDDRAPAEHVETVRVKTVDLGQPVANSIVFTPQRAYVTNNKIYKDNNGYKDKNAYVGRRSAEPTRPGVIKAFTASSTRSN